MIEPPSGRQETLNLIPSTQKGNLNIYKTQEEKNPQTYLYEHHPKITIDFGVLQNSLAFGCFLSNLFIK